MNINTNFISTTVTIENLDLSSLYDPNNTEYPTNISTTTDPVTFTVDPDLIKSWSTNDLTSFATNISTNIVTE